VNDELLPTEVYMAVFDDGGHETIIEIRVTDNGKLPLVAIDEKGLAILQQFSQQTADKTGQTVSIICFTGRQLYESYSPSATGD